jgi:transposase
MLQRGGEVVIRMLANVKQVTIGPLIGRMIAKGTLVYTDEYDIDSRLVEWGYSHKTVCHGAGEFARDDDGAPFHGWFRLSPRLPGCGQLPRRAPG